jgi:uncharacterized membrane protein
VKRKEKKTKYDTNPLDPERARRADDEWGKTRPQTAPAAEVTEPWGTESPTKRYDSSIPVSYPSINVPPGYPPQTRDVSARVLPETPVTAVPSSKRTVPGLGLPENLTLALPYAPFFIGAVAGVLELFLTPRSEPRARFHAAQGLALHLAAIVIKLIFNTLESITGSSFGGKIFWIASTVLFIIATIRAWKGETVHVAAVDDVTAWLNDRIDPQKTQKQK